MSADEGNAGSDAAPPVPTDGRHQVQFHLEFAFDDPDDPALLTVFPPDAGDALDSQWVTIDEAHAVPVEEIR